ASAAAAVSSWIDGEPPPCSDFARRVTTAATPRTTASSTPTTGAAIVANHSIVGAKRQQTRSLLRIATTFGDSSAKTIVNAASGTTTAKIAKASAACSDQPKRWTSTGESFSSTDAPPNTPATEPS